MKLFEKRKHLDGSRDIHVLGRKVFSYKHKRSNRLRATIRNNGDNNSISILHGENKNLKIEIFGDNNVVDVRADSSFYAHICIGMRDSPANGCSIVIGEDTTSNGTFMILMENDSTIRIGKDCMFASDVVIYGSDTHSIVDSKGRLLNIGKGVEIGNHVWVGRFCKVLKNVNIADNTVIGIGSVVSSSIGEENCIAVGVPAKIVKRGVNWDRRRPQQMLSSGS